MFACLPSSRRRSRTVGWALGHLALLILALTGCHRGVKTDIVEREMRWQEDQIYAMEDYLAQYQQLLRDSRAENAELKRQLGQRQPASRSAAPDDGPSSRGPDGPLIEAPDVPGPTDVDPALPGVPPLDDASWDGPRLDVTDHRGGTDAPRRQPAFVVASTDTPQATQPVVVERRQPVSDRPEHVWLHGEVFAADERGGPRLLIDVEPLAASGHTAKFTGTLSLMIYDPDGPPGGRSLARWTFDADALQQAAAESPGDRAMQFRLQLPADVPTDQPVELWVRLLSDEGRKLLAHVELDLQQLGAFSSVRRRSLVEAQVAQEIHDDGQRKLAQRPGWSRWQIARPGESGALRQRLGRPAGKWKAATEPLPTAVHRSPPAWADSNERPSTPRREPGPQDSDLVAPPTWTPDRQADTLPVWSPTR